VERLKGTLDECEKKAKEDNEVLRDIITSRERFFSVARKHYRGDEDIEVVIKGMVENAYI